MVVRHRYLHYLDRGTKTLEEKALTDDNPKKYTDSVIEESLSQDNTRNYNPQSMSQVTELVTSIVKNPNSQEIPHIAERLSQRLLDKEANRQTQVDNFSELQKGALLQALLQDDDDKDTCYYILCKIDFSVYVDEVKFEDKRGLPKKHKVYKSCIYTFKSMELDSIVLFDISGKIAKYWSSDFLELEPITDDEGNTKAIIKGVRKVIRQNTKDGYHDDRKALVSALYGYFEREENYTYSSFKAALFDNYIKRDDKLNLPNIIQKVEKVCKRIDRSFTVHKPTLRIFLTEKNVQVNDKVYLTFKGLVDDQPNLIRAIQSDGRKYIQIETTNDTLFDRFRENR